MKKALNFAAAGLAILAVLAFVQPGYARLHGTDPGTDIWCMGPDGAEVCVDASGNIIPTTTNDTSLGTSALRYSNLYTTLLNVSGAATISGAISGMSSILGPVPAVQTLGSGFTITADACGGIKRVQGASTYASAANPFTSPTALAGCIMRVINVGTATLTIGTTNTSNFLTNNGAVLTVTGTASNFMVASDGTNWFEIGTVNAH